MASDQYHLYRIKFIRPAQLALFEPDLSASEIFIRALHEKPFMPSARGNLWHIGNIERLNESSGRFAIGRITMTTVEKLDRESGDFVVQQDDSGPYTHVFFDNKVGVIAIGKKGSLAPEVRGIARHLRALFEQTETVFKRGIEVRVDAIPDPEDFVQKLRSAYAIKRFRATFTGPNPVDADELFQKPLSVYCQRLEGRTGSVEVLGTSLNEEAVEAVAKSTAATGNNASASIQTKRGKRPIPISLKGDAVRVAIENPANLEHAIDVMRREYSKVRK